METITLTINGNAISTRAGRTVLEVARRHGIHIPTLCHHDALRPIGACRLCQVEDENRGVVVPACVTTVAQGMVIRTDSDRVRRNRRNIIRLLMAAHPESCVVCEKGNSCELRELAAQFGVGAHGLDRMPYHPKVMDLNPIMSRDLSKCIMCAKCVRADQEVVCEGVIDYNFRGFDAHPSTLYQAPLEESQCTFCGSCMNVCPTGAIAEKNKRRLVHAGARTRSVCSYCACGCSIQLEHGPEGLRSVAPTGEPHTANGITLCVKGHFGHDYLSHRDRLATPLIRTEEGFQPVGWDEALALVSEKLGAAAPAALGFVGGARATNEEAYLFQKLARHVFRTNNIDFSARLPWAPVMKALTEATGFAAGSCSFKDLEQSDVILVIGADPTQTAPVLGYHIKRAAKGAGKLILIDPVKSKLAPLAEIWLRPKIGADGHILAGIIKVILEEDLEDRQFEAAKTVESNGMRDFFEKLTVAEAAEAAGLDEESLRETARLFARASTATVVFGQGLIGQEGSENLARMLIDLVLLTGALGKDKSGLIPVLKDANAQGGLDMGLCPDMLPGQRPLDQESLDRPAALWGQAPPSEQGLDLRGMLEAAASGRMEAMYILGEDTLAAFPDRTLAEAALDKVGFLVVQDLFLTETARQADLVLPSAAWAEKEGTATNMERRIQRLSKALISPGAFPGDWEVLTRLAAARGHDWGYENPAAIFKEIEKAVPLYSTISEADLRAKPVFWPQPGLDEVIDTLPHGIGRPDGKAKFLTPGALGRPVEPGDGYPLVLISGHILTHLGTGARSSRSRRLASFSPAPYLEVHPDDIEAAGLEAGGSVRVVSEAGAVEVPVRACDRLPPGAVFMPASFDGARPGSLFSSSPPAGDSRGNIKHVKVRLEKAGDPS